VRGNDASTTKPHTVDALLRLVKAPVAAGRMIHGSRRDVRSIDPKFEGDTLE
jgi:hypothetical protein